MLEQIELNDVIRAVAGKNEDGNAKAITALQHQVERGVDEEGAPVIDVEDQANSLFAEVNIIVSNGKLTTIISFEDFDDPDYAQFRGLLRDYEQCDATDGNHFLVLTIADEETANLFISMVVDMVCFDGVDPIIRLIGDANQARYYTLADDNEPEDEFADLEEIEE